MLEWIGSKMNERILKLALDAGLLNYVDNETPRRYFVHGHADLEEVEKFAELIVQECLEACSRANEIRHFVPPTQEQVVLSCMREIETTFRS